jgi:hypothetical protein
MTTTVDDDSNQYTIEEIAKLTSLSSRLATRIHKHLTAKMMDQTINPFESSILSVINTCNIPPSDWTSVLMIQECIVSGRYSYNLVEKVYKSKGLAVPSSLHMYNSDSDSGSGSNNNEQKNLSVALMWVLGC